MNNLKELKLLPQVADIIEELEMIRNLADKQREVLKSLLLALRYLYPSKRESSHNGSQVVFNFPQTDFNTDTIYTIKTSQTKLEESVEPTKRLAEKIEGATRDTVVSADETLLLLIAEVDELTQEGERTHKKVGGGFIHMFHRQYSNKIYFHTQLFSLLDFIQTAEALKETRSTTQQGRVLMLFTIITIIFVSQR